MENNTLYTDIRNNIEIILESNIPQISNEYRDLIVNSIMTTLRDSGLKPHTWTPSYITDLDEVKDWNICGYRVEDLYKLALILRDKRVEEIDLRDFNNCFFDGYKRAQEDFKASLEQSINSIIGGADISS